MPELPEVETIVRDIRPGLVGRTILSARLSHDDVSPTPFGIFRQVKRHEYSEAMSRQLLDASQKGPGDLNKLLRSNGTWFVG